VHLKSRNNKLMKYADDTNLLVPENTNCTLSEEFDHIKDWAKGNKMVINMSKSKELVFTGHTQVEPICLRLLLIMNELKSHNSWCHVIRQFKL